MNFGTTLRGHLMMSTSGNIFYIAIGYKKKRNGKVASSNLNIEIHQLFSKKRILGVRVTIVQQKISGYLTRTCFSITCIVYLK